MNNPARRSHADDQGAAIELLTAILTDEGEAIRRGVRVVHRSAAEAAGLVIGLAKVATTLLRHVAQGVDEPVEVLKAMAPQLHADALELDETFGPPLPGSAALKQMAPPELAFITGEILKSTGVVLSGVGAINAPDNLDGEGSSIGDRRKAFEAMELLSAAADLFRDPPDWGEFDAPPD